MRKIGLLALSAALLMSCGGANPSSSSTSSKAEESSISSESTVMSSESSESIVSSESESELSSEELSSSEAVSNDGSVEYPFTVSEAYDIAVELAVGENTDCGYCVSGIVDGEVSWYKGRLSFTITDGENDLYVYNMNNEENKASYKEGEFDLEDGDALVVTGAFKNYNGTLEICYVKDVANCYRVA